MTVVGEVGKGHGVASLNLSKVYSLIEERSGLSGIVPGTLNLKLDNHFPVEKADFVISEDEYNGVEWIRFLKCQVNGIPSLIMRPKNHDDPKRSELWCRLELMAQVNLRESLGLSDGDKVEVLVTPW